MRPDYFAHRPQKALHPPNFTVSSARFIGAPNTQRRIALVAELVDAADSKSVIRKDVGVQVPPGAPFLSGFDRDYP